MELSDEKQIVLGQVRADETNSAKFSRGWGMALASWKMLKDAVLSFIEDEALTRGAAIAFYTVTSVAPVLLIVVAIAGLVFGRDAAQNAITAQFSDLMGQQTAEVLQSAVASAAGKSSSIIATIIGVATLNRNSIRGIWRDASCPELDLENQTYSHHGVPANPCTRHQLRIGRRIRIFAYRLTGDKRRAHCLRQLFGHVCCQWES